MSANMVVLPSLLLAAPVAELVDATDLKSVGRKAVPVRFRPGAPQFACQHSSLTTYLSTAASEPFCVESPSSSQLVERS